MTENKQYSLPKGAEEMQKATIGIEPVDTVDTRLTGPLLFILGTAVFLGIAILIVVTDESPAAIGVSYVGIVLFLGSFILLFRQYMVKQVDAYFDLARSFIEPYLVEGERFIAVTWFRRLGLSVSYDLGSEQGLLVFTTHRLFMLKIKGVYKQILESSPESIQVSICDAGSSGKVKWGGLILLPAHGLFLNKLSVVPEGTEEKHVLGYFKIGINGRTIRSISHNLCVRDKTLARKHSRRKAAFLIVVVALVLIVGGLVGRRIIIDRRTKAYYPKPATEVIDLFE